MVIAKVRVPIRLERGFAKLGEEDRAFLRAWFRVPATASTRDTCRVLLKRAPSLVLEDIKNLAVR